MRVESGTVEVIELLVAMVVKLVLGFAVVGWDERRLAKRRPDLYELAWPAASRMSAIVVFQEIGVVVHFLRTRRWGARGALLGIVAGFFVVLVTGLVLEGVDLALGAPG
jgi:hypothetical protein